MNLSRISWSKIKSAYFFCGLFLLCISYLIFQYFFIPYQALAVDEFVFARHIYDYTLHIPYKDFAPYKGVLGYYLLSLPMFLSHALFTPLFYIKAEVALINVIMLIIVSKWSIRFFDKKAILLTLLILLANQCHLIYSADLRVDMLATWFCLLAGLSLLEKRFVWGGVLSGIGFLISQKTLWYIMAANGAIGFCWLLATPRYSLRSLFLFNVALLATISVYVIFWALISSPYTVLYNLFYEAYIQAVIDWYAPAYSLFWQVALNRGPFLFFFWPFTYLVLANLKSTDALFEQRIFIVCFSSIALLLFIQYKQPFPYNFVFTIPAFFLLYTEFFSWLFNPLNSNLTALFKKPMLAALIAGYTLTLFLFINFLSLPLIYNLLALLPLLISYAFTLQRNTRLYSLISLVTISLFLIVGIVSPLYKTGKIIKFLDGSYQRSVILLAAELMEKEGEYVAGIPFLYNKDQPVMGAKNLIGPAQGYLKNPSEKLRALLLPSLYLAPTTPKQLIDDLNSQPVKLIITNYRIKALPLSVRKFIHTHYEHFYGSIYLYAPLVSPRELSFSLKFSGRYQVKTTGTSPIFLDGKKRRADQIIYLTKGDHISDNTKPYRLLLIPTMDKKKLAEGYEGDDWISMTQSVFY